MTEKDAAAKAKQHDLEETPREGARRLVRADMARLTAKFDVLRKRLYTRGRYLSDSDKREVEAFIERQFEMVRTLLDGVGESPEFGFSSDILDGDGDLR